MNNLKRFPLFLTIFIFLSATFLFAQTNELARTPPMGWLSWNLFEGDINEDLVKEIADAMVANGLKDAGYEYLILDDLWQGGRDEKGRIVPDPAKFPNGMKVVADYVHAKGLKFGIYTDIAEKTCGGAVGSYGFEERDARTFAEWGVDYVKCDYCYAPKDILSAMERYAKFGEALRSSGRKMVFAICEWGQRAPWLWGEKAGGQLWRTTWDLRDTWEHGRYNSGHAGIMEVLDRQVGLAKFAGPGHWNDPDMLLVGLYGKGKSASHDGANGCSNVEYQAQMSLWCLLSAPLLVCCDVRAMNEATKRILTNREIIAVNQDPLGRQAVRIRKMGVREIWGKKLSDGSWAVGFLNRDDENKRNIDLNFKWIGIKDAAIIRDLWRHENLGKFSTSFATVVGVHEVKLLKVIPIRK